MSKLADKLAKLLKNTGPSIGFRVSQAVQSRGMLLVAEVPGNKVSLTKGAVAAGVDVLVIRMDSLRSATLKDAAKVVGDVVWGVHVNKMDSDDVATLRGAGADFVVVNASAAPAAVLSEKDLGKAIRVDAGWADTMIRTLDQVSLDAVLFETDEGDGPGLSLNMLLQCQRVSMLARKPLLVSLPAGTDGAGAGVQALHSIGIEGVVFKYVDDASAGPLEKLKRAIDALPAYRGRGKGMALLPKIEAAAAAEPEEEEDDDDDD